MVVGRRNAGQNQSQPLRNTDDEGEEAKHKDWRRLSIGDRTKNKTKRESQGELEPVLARK
jgi:hypothetical protein